MGSRESLSSHSSEKNGQTLLSSPPSSPTIEASLSSAATASPPAASSQYRSNGSDQKDTSASPHLVTSSSWTSSQLTSTQQTSSASSSMSSLLSTERTLSAKGNSNASLSSIKESRVASGASSFTSTQCSSVERASSLRESRPIQRGSSLSSLKSSYSADQQKSSVTETRVTNSASPQQPRKLYRTASSSSSSSSSLFTYQLSTSSSLTSLHISEGKSLITGRKTCIIRFFCVWFSFFPHFIADYKSCHGSVQSLMSLNPGEGGHARKISHMRCGSDLITKHSAAAASSNGYQKPESLWVLLKLLISHVTVF